MFFRKLRKGCYALSCPPYNLHGIAHFFKLRGLALCAFIYTGLGGLVALLKTKQIPVISSSIYCNTLSAATKLPRIAFCAFIYTGSGSLKLQHCRCPRRLMTQW